MTIETKANYRLYDGVNFSFLLFQKFFVILCITVIKVAPKNTLHSIVDFNIKKNLLNQMYQSNRVKKSLICT